MFGEALASTHASLTAEGDNRVLMVKVVKDLLTIYAKRPDYFYNGDSIKLTDKSQVFCLKTLSTIFLIVEKFKLDRLINKMASLKANGKTNYEILMFETSD